MVASGPSSGIDMYSAWAPNRSPLYPNTRSPTVNAVTRPPTASTTPANSFPGTVVCGLKSPVRKAVPLASEPLTWAAVNAEVASLAMRGRPDRKPQSVRFTVVA